MEFRKPAPTDLDEYYRDEIDDDLLEDEDDDDEEEIEEEGDES